MDRTIVYPGALPQDTDILSSEVNTMIAIGFALAAAFGTGTLADGLACAPTFVPSMSITVGPGSVMTLLTVDSSSFGSLASNGAALMKMGINIGSTSIGPFTAPGTAGQSQNFLIQAQASENDTVPVVMPFFNASAPSSPYSGPANSGTPQNTKRTQTVLLEVKAGAAATTGSQTTPTPDAGFVGLWQVTIANGATTIITGNISLYPGAPFIAFKIPNIGAPASGLFSNDSGNLVPGGTRVLGTPYTNGPRPMQLYVDCVSSSALSNLTLTINGVVRARFGQISSGTEYWVGGIIPAGATYEVTVTNGSGTATLEIWSEFT